MSLNASSPTSFREQWRFPPTRQRHAGLMKCTLITSTLFVLGFCATMLFLRFFIKDIHDKTCVGCTEKKMHKYEHLNSDHCQEVCTTEDCIKTAEHIIRRMDPTIDPCEDFYNFSCSKYDKVSMEEMTRAQFLNDVLEGLLYIIRDMIENIPKHLPENIPGYSASKARNLYDSCISFHSTEEMAVPTALKYLENFGIRNWPHLNSDYQFMNPDLDEAIKRLSLYEANPFFEFNMPENKETNLNSTEGGSDAPVVIKIGTSRRQIFLSPVTSKEELAVAMIDILEYFGMSGEIINTTIEDALKFDESLGDIKQASRMRISNCLFNASISCASYEFDCRNEKHSEMEWWCAIAVNVMDDTGIREKYPHFHIILEDKFYFDAVRHLVDRAGQRTLAHAVALQFLIQSSMMMNYRFRRTSIFPVFAKEASNRLQGDRSSFCVSWVLSFVPTLVGAAFYNTKYSGKLKKEGDEINEDIQKYLIPYVRNLTWIDPEAKESLEKLLWTVNVSLNYYLPFVSNASKVDEFHKKLRTTDESFLSNAMEIRRFTTITGFLHHDDASFLLTHRRSRFELNPKYMMEVIYLDFSCFIYPLIAAGRPRYFNLGSFGFFLAHEYSHAIDIFFRDPQNMSANFENTLREKKKCLTDQFSKYTIDQINVKVNGSLTLNENIADYFSIRPVHEAMKQYQEKHGREKLLPGLNFNSDQLFFIIFAQSMCETNTLETLKIYPEDPHSPNKYRILGIMKNFGPFSEAFNCPLGSPMNPEEKCNFWS